MGLFKKNEAVKAIENSMLMYPKDWIIWEYKTIHTKSDTKIWTGNGLLFIRIEGLPSTSLVDKFALRKAINELKATQILQSINE